jgi:hypothetical protein
MSRLAIASVSVALACVVTCRAPSREEQPQGKTPRAASAKPRPKAPRAPVPPPVQRACAQDADCAVARVEVTGPHACCNACATTPGNKKWHVALQRHCGANPPKDCYPLACPQGPTRAVCNQGVCEATASGPDGGPVSVPVLRQCLPAIACDTWAGCAMVRGNEQDGYFVEESSRVARGEIANVESPCTKGGKCEAARIYPPEAVCPPHTEPPRIDPPPYACAVVEGQCKQQKLR